MQNSFTANNRWQMPLISSLSFKGMYGDMLPREADCDIEVISNDPVGSDAIYTLPQLPSGMHTREINYKIRVPYILSEMQDVYYKGVFTNSLNMNLDNFDKFDFLHIPFEFAEMFVNAEIGHMEEVCMDVRGHRVYQPALRQPSEICGKLFVCQQKYLSDKHTNKQKQRCFRSCIFK